MYSSSCSKFFNTIVRRTIKTNEYLIVHSIAGMKNLNCLCKSTLSYLILSNLIFTISLFKYRQYLNFLHAVLIIIYL